MPQNITDWLSGIGSAATAIAALVAVVALLTSIYFNRKEKTRIEAASIRQNLYALSAESHDLSKLLDDGSALILGATHITNQFGEKLGPGATPKDFWYHLENNNQMVLSVVIAGWNDSKLTSTLNEMLTELRRTSLPLKGILALHRKFVNCYDGIADDACSAYIFLRILSDAQHLLLKDHRNSGSLPIILNALSGELQGNAALYYAKKYREAITQINKVIELSVRLFLGFDDNNLVKLSNADTTMADSADTRAESIKILLNSIQPKISKTDFERLSTLNDEIEKSLSKYLDKGGNKQMLKAPTQGEVDAIADLAQERIGGEAGNTVRHFGEIAINGGEEDIHNWYNLVEKLGLNE